MLDLICNTPFYDRYLAESLVARGVKLRLAVATFDREPGYFARHRVPIGRGLLDVTGKLRLADGRPRRLLKAAEWLTNQTLVSLSVGVAPTDILHIQWLTFVGKLPIERWMIRLAHRRGTKVVYTVHDVLPHERVVGDVEAFGAIYRMVDGLICHTNASREQLVEHFGINAAKVRVIPHGALFHDLRGEPRETARSQLGYFDADLVVLCSGMIRPYKGIEVLLEAWVRLQGTNPTLKLAIAGRGKDPAYVEQIRRRIGELDLQRSVRFDARYLSEDEMVRYHAAADVLVYPYREVTQSGALLAGMSFGKPIVATNVGGLGETLRAGEQALLVPPDDPAALARALLELAERPDERARLGAAARAELDRSYAWPSIAGQTIAFYREVIGVPAATSTRAEQAG